MFYKHLRNANDPYLHRLLTCYKKWILCDSYRNVSIIGCHLLISYSVSHTPKAYYVFGGQQWVLSIMSWKELKSLPLTCTVNSFNKYNQYSVKNSLSWSTERRWCSYIKIMSSRMLMQAWPRNKFLRLPEICYHTPYILKVVTTLLCADNCMKHTRFASQVEVISTVHHFSSF